MTMVENLLDVFRRRFDEQQPRQLTYRQLVARSKKTDPNSYRWINQQQQEFAEDVTEQLFELAQHWCELDTEAPSLADGAPRPKSEWQVRPLL